MAYARVVSFDGVTPDRLDALRGRVQDQGGPPEDVPATEVMILHDPDAGRALAILFFETEDDYRRGDETLSAMPAGETPGQRTSVMKYEVAVRRSRET